MNCIFSTLIFSLAGNTGWGLQRKQKKDYELITRACDDEENVQKQPWQNQYAYNSTWLHALAEKFLARNLDDQEDYLLWLKILYIGHKNRGPLADIIPEALAAYERNDNRPTLLRFKQEQRKLRRLNQKKLSEITISEEKLWERKQLSDPMPKTLSRKKRDRTQSFIDYLYDYIYQLKQTGKSIEIQTLDDLLGEVKQQKETRPRGYKKKTPDGIDNYMYYVLKELSTSNPPLFAEIISKARTGKYIETAIRFGYEDMDKINFNALAKQLGKNRSTVQRGFYRALANIKTNPEVKHLLQQSIGHFPERKDRSVKTFAEQAVDDFVESTTQYSSIEIYTDFKKYTE